MKLKCLGPEAASSAETTDLMLNEQNCKTFGCGIKLVKIHQGMNDAK